MTAHTLSASIQTSIWRIANQEIHVENIFLAGRYSLPLGSNIWWTSHYLLGNKRCGESCGENGAKTVWRFEVTRKGETNASFQFDCGSYPHNKWGSKVLQFVEAVHVLRFRDSFKWVSSCFVVNERRIFRSMPTVWPDQHALISRIPLSDCFSLIMIMK